MENLVGNHFRILVDKIILFCLTSGCEYSFNKKDKNKYNSLSDYVTSIENKMKICYEEDYIDINDNLKDGNKIKFYLYDYSRNIKLVEAMEIADRKIIYSMIKNVFIKLYIKYINFICSNLTKIGFPYVLVKIISEYI